MRNTFLSMVFFLICVPLMAATPTATQLSVKKIWDQAPHCAFTDLTYWKDQFVCAFREGREHVSTDGRIRVLSSKDGERWSSMAVLTLDGYDLRDAGLSITPDNRLMLIGGAAPRKKDKESAPTGSFVAFSNDGIEWTKPKIVSEPGRWLWRVTWHDGKAYGISYSSARGALGESQTSLMVSDDGISYRELAPKIFSEGTPTEATLRFGDDGTMYCLQRRDGKPAPKSAFFGSSRPPYKEWKWHDLGQFIGGPNFIRIPSGQWLAAGRFVHGEDRTTDLAVLDLAKNSVEPILTLPSGGDNSYPGLLWRDDVLWMSYYSSHEGRTSIYLAKIGIGRKPKALTNEQAAACEKIGLDADEMSWLVDKPLYKCSEAEVDKYLKFLSATEPDLRKRIVRLARKNIGQPYELYLLGEMPFEPYDPQPIYCLGKSDCLVFSEHTYAMALARDWPEFMRLLQRIRYRDGQLGVVTRNHYTEADWNISNRWLVDDITKQVAGDKAVKFHEAIDRAKFFKRRYKLDVKVPVEQHDDIYLPYPEIDRAKSQLRDGDFVNVVRATAKKGTSPQNEIFGGNAFVGHVGMIAHGKDGELHMIHSIAPKVREETFESFISRSLKDRKEKEAEGKPILVGFKFLRLQEDPLIKLKALDGPDAPRVTLPGGGQLKTQ